jgi:hypothetical protein
MAASLGAAVHILLTLAALCLVVIAMVSSDWFEVDRTAAVSALAG